MSTDPSPTPPTSEPGHTPGPWYAYSIILDGVHAGYRYGIANARPCGITEDEDGCRQVDFPDWNAGSRIIAKTMDSDTARDDARLIASAPALLAAAEAALPLLLLAAIKAPDRECAKRYSETCGVLTAAIKAAKGGVA